MASKRKISLTDEERALLRRLGSIGGKKGNANMTDEQKSARGKKAVAARLAQREERRRAEGAVA
jgi:hypothetical protein